jgi:hypothetical protein
MVGCVVRHGLPRAQVYELGLEGVLGLQGPPPYPRSRRLSPSPEAARHYAGARRLGWDAAHAAAPTATFVRTLHRAAPPPRPRAGLYSSPTRYVPALYDGVPPPVPLEASPAYDERFAARGGVGAAPGAPPPAPVSPPPGAYVEGRAGYGYGSPRYSPRAGGAHGSPARGVRRGAAAPQPPYPGFQGPTVHRLGVAAARRYWAEAAPHPDVNRSERLYP